MPGPAKRSNSHKLGTGSKKVHVGELQALLSGLLPDEDGFLEDGAKEVEGDLNSR